MIKGIDVISKINYEMKHNLDFVNQSVKVPIKDLELLIDLAVSNQYRLDQSLMERLMYLEMNQCKCKSNYPEIQKNL